MTQLKFNNFFFEIFFIKIKMQQIFERKMFFFAFIKIKSLQIKLNLGWIDSKTPLKHQTVDILCWGFSF